MSQCHLTISKHLNHGALPCTIFIKTEPKRQTAAHPSESPEGEGSFATVSDGLSLSRAREAARRARAPSGEKPWGRLCKRWLSPASPKSSSSLTSPTPRPPSPPSPQGGRAGGSRGEGKERKGGAPARGPPGRDPGSFDLKDLPWAERPLLATPLGS